MLSNSLNTNEVKKADATEVEFSRMSQMERKTVFSAVAETPALPHRLTISHQESGGGVKLRRRSLVRFDKTVTGVDGLPEKCSAYLVVDAPVGNITDYTEPKNVLAEVLSFCATTGAATTVLFDCTGNGASALINGTL